MGTKGAFEDYPPRIYVEGQAGGERWGTIDEWKKKFEASALDEARRAGAKHGGHGGMDFVMAYRLVECMREGLAPDLRRVRRGGVERAVAADGDVRRQGKRADEVPGLHPR